MGLTVCKLWADRKDKSWLMFKPRPNYIADIRRKAGMVSILLTDSNYQHAVSDNCIKTLYANSLLVSI